MNNTTPNPSLGLLSSNIPPIISSVPKNPKITGNIWENIVVPVKAIFYHLLIF